MDLEQQHEIRNAIMCCAYLIRRVKEYLPSNSEIASFFVDQLSFQIERIDKAVNKRRGSSVDEY